jgi:hypothetical protein
MQAKPVRDSRPPSTSSLAAVNMSVFEYLQTPHARARARRGEKFCSDNKRTTRGATLAFANSGASWGLCLHMACAGSALGQPSEIAWRRLSVGRSVGRSADGHYWRRLTARTARRPSWRCRGRWTRRCRSPG